MSSPCPISTRLLSGGWTSKTRQILRRSPTSLWAMRWKLFIRSWEGYLLRGRMGFTLSRSWGSTSIYFRVQATTNIDFLWKSTWRNYWKRTAIASTNEARSTTTSMDGSFSTILSWFFVCFNLNQSWSFISLWRRSFGSTPPISNLPPVAKTVPFPLFSQTDWSVHPRGAKQWSRLNRQDEHSARELCWQPRQHNKVEHAQTNYQVGDGLQQKSWRFWVEYKINKNADFLWNTVQNIVVTLFADL